MRAADAGRSAPCASGPSHQQPPGRQHGRSGGRQQPGPHAAAMQEADEKGKSVRPDRAAAQQPRPPSDESSDGTRLGFARAGQGSDWS
jgi:hypothetical protein